MENYETWGIQACHQSRENLKLDSSRGSIKKNCTINKPTTLLVVEKITLQKDSSQRVKQICSSFPCNHPLILLGSKNWSLGYFGKKRVPILLLNHWYEIQKLVSSLVLGR